MKRNLWQRMNFRKYVGLAAAVPLIILFQNCGSGFAIRADLLGTTGSKSSDSTSSTDGFGTYLKPFAANSPWNSKPLAYTLGTATIPRDAYEPTISAGEFSTSVYLATEADGPMTVTASNIADSWTSGDIVIPHWPAKAASASGSDGHLDIVDSTTGILHSFWVARVDANGHWTAALYAWSHINGQGFGDAAHFYQGARAAAVPTSAGIIRAHEIDDGKDLYEHALAMSLTYSGLLGTDHGYIYPATSADSDFSRNTGAIPEGGLVMLPKDFDLTKISSPAIRKVAKTLMTYGAYVIDRNDGTPFSIYQEIGTQGIAYWPQSGDTHQILDALRLATVTQFADGNGVPYTPSNKQNILSMRGYYNRQSGTVSSTYDMYNQKRVWGPTTTVTQEFLYVGLPVAWAIPNAGETYTITAHTEGGAKLQIQAGDFDSGMLGNGESKTFVWSKTGAALIVILQSGIGASSSATGTLIQN